VGWERPVRVLSSVRESGPAVRRHSSTWWSFGRNAGCGCPLAVTEPPGRRAEMLSIAPAVQYPTCHLPVPLPRRDLMSGRCVIRQLVMDRTCGEARQVVACLLVRPSAQCAGGPHASSSSSCLLFAASAAPCGAHRTLLILPTNGGHSCLSERTYPVGPFSAPSSLPAAQVRP